MEISDLFSYFVPTVHAEEATHVEEFILLSTDIPTTTTAHHHHHPPEALVLTDTIELDDTAVKECAKSCTNLKEQLDQCNGRVEKGSKEDCMEEFFHFMHCADECAAPAKMLATTH